MSRIKSSLFIVLLLLLASGAKGVNLDSLKFIAEKSKNDTARYHALFKLGIVHIDSAFDKSKLYWSQALELASKKKFWKLAADAYHQLGYIMQKKGDLKAALQNLVAAQSIYEQQNNRLAQAEVQNDIGLIYRSWARYDQAIDYFSQALNTFRTLNHLEGIGMVSNNIGQVYYYRQDYVKAIDYFKTYLNINQKNQYYRAVAAASNNIASSYMELNSLDLAHTYFLKALNIYDSLNIQIGVGIIQDNLGTLFLKKGQFADALLFHTNALEKFQKLGSASRECIALKNVGVAYMKSNNPQKATEYLNKSLQIAIRENIKEIIQEIYYNLSLIYENSKSYGKALAFHKRYEAIKDSLQKSETEEKLRLLEEQMKDDEAEKELTILKASISDLKKSNRVLIASGIFVLMLISFIGLLLIFKYKRKAKNNNTEVSTNSNNNSAYLKTVNELLLKKLFNNPLVLKSPDSNLSGTDTFVFEKGNRSIFIIYSLGKSNRIIEETQRISDELIRVLNIATDEDLNYLNIFLEALRSLGINPYKDFYTAKALVFNKEAKEYAYFGNSNTFLIKQGGGSVKVLDGQRFTHELGYLLLGTCMYKNHHPMDIEASIAAAAEKISNYRDNEIEELIASTFEMERLSAEETSATLVVFKLQYK